MELYVGIAYTTYVYGVLPTVKFFYIPRYVYVLVCINVLTNMNVMGL